MVADDSSSASRASFWAAAAALHTGQPQSVAASGGGGADTVSYSLEGTTGMLAELNEARVLLETKVGGSLVRHLIRICVCVCRAESCGVSAACR